MERPRRRRKKLAALKRKGRTTTRSERACACAARPIRETYVREIDGPVLYSCKR